MTTREMLVEVFEALPETRQRELLSYARYLHWQDRETRDELEDWTRFGEEEWSGLYGPDEPEYTEADIKPELNR